jgi:hypothetical protein
MFHVPAHKSGSAGQVIPTVRVECECGWACGSPECDEGGAPYTCYRCCNSGSFRVAPFTLLAVCADEVAEAARAEREAQLLQQLFIEQCGPDADRADYFTRTDEDGVWFIPRSGAMRSSVWMDDDIPF